MKRRAFITLLGGAAAWPLAARAQQSGKLPTMGIIGSGTPATHGHWYAALVQRLRELGWIDGRTVVVEYRWAQGRDERFAEIAAEFVQRKVDVIVTSSTVGVMTAKQATSVIPIVFVAGDPVGTGLVASLARPGGNATGLSLQQTETNGKRFELLREVVPGYEASSWFGLGAPKGTSTEITEKLNKEIDAIVADPNMRARLVGLGFQPMSLRSAEFGKFIADQIDKWAKVIKSAGIKPE